MDSGLPVGARRLALLPVNYLMQQDEQFDRLCSESGRFDETYRDVFVAGFWGYQLHAYLDLVGARFGVSMRQAVRRQFLEFFDELAGVGTAVDATLDLIDVATQITPGTPAATPEIGISTEAKVAFALLLGLPQSPDYVPDPGQRLQYLQETQVDVDRHLSRCLARCRLKIQDTFSTTLDCMELDALVFGGHSPAAGSGFMH